MDVVGRALLSFPNTRSNITSSTDFYRQGYDESQQYRIPRRGQTIVIITIARIKELSQNTKYKGPSANEKKDKLNKEEPMFRRIRIKIAVIATAIVLPVGTLLAFGASPALADYSDTQICATVCVNAWYGGPAVNVYTAKGAVPNDEFAIHTLRNGNTYIQFVGGGPYSGQCVGDFNNNSGYADTGLDGCPSNSSGGGWGTNFKEISCGNEGGLEFKNNHWGGYLAPGGNSNGDAFYLNVAKPYCFGFFPPTQK